MKAGFVLKTYRGNTLCTDSSFCPDDLWKGKYREEGLAPMVFGTRDEAETFKQKHNEELPPFEMGWQVEVFRGKK